MALLRKLFWVVIFLVSTIGFIVLFEHGPDQFAENFSKQVEDFRKAAMELISPPAPSKNG